MIIKINGLPIDETLNPQALPIPTVQEIDAVLQGFMNMYPATKAVNGYICSMAKDILEPSLLIGKYVTVGTWNDLNSLAEKFFKLL